MSDPRTDLLHRLTAEAAANGLTDRSLRDLAEAVGTSHRMLLYHFGSRAGLIHAIVERVEADQRQALVDLASTTEASAELIKLLWHQVSSPELRPFVRLFFECVALTGGKGLTDPWLDLGSEVAASIEAETDEDLLRLGVAVSRGLLIDVLAKGDAEDATRSLERFITMWEQSSSGPHRVGRL
jgi:AcrR family transcriptional regulator